jgi:hypothetical protein
MAVFCRFRNRWKTMRPIMAASRDDPHTFRLNMDSNTIAVPFHFEHPSRSSRRGRFEQCKARLYAVWHRIELKLRLGGIAPLTWTASDRNVGLAKKRL